MIVSILGSYEQLDENKLIEEAIRCHNGWLDKSNGYTANI